MFARFVRLVRFLIPLALGLSAWPLCANGLTGPISLGFASSYTAPDGSSCTHRGVDVALASGSAVDAPRTGTVRFAGRVPGPQGGTVLAVTLDTADGAVTMLPLASLRVEAGQRVEAGDEVGELAASGDPSTAASHLHMGLKRGSVYIDPAVLLAPAAPASQSTPSGQPAASPSHAPATSPSALPAAVPVGAQVVAPATPAGAGEPASAPVANALSATSAGAVAAQGLPSGVTLAGDASASKAMPVHVSSPAAHTVQRAASHSARATRAALTPGVIALVASVLSACCFLVPLLLTRRAIASRVVSPPVSDRLGILLQHLKAGDTLRGLTSCSGPLPSQSRGH